MLVDGINASDYPVVQSLTLLFVVVFLAINVTVDILYAVIDPRIRVS
jgi:peptide/nickel transport system permease protein